jgi:hypothetical protein
MRLEPPVQELAHHAFAFFRTLFADFVLPAAILLLAKSRPNR